MLSFKAQIPWQQTLTNLTRFHNTIKGINEHYEIIEVDTRNHLVDKALTFVGNDYKFPIINDCKFIRSNLGYNYYFSFNDRIVGANGEIVDQSNQKADFVKGIDGASDVFVFAKFHKLHHKYSLNLKKIGRDKKIIGLFDAKIQNIAYLENQQGNTIVMESHDDHVRLFYGEDFSTEEETKVEKFITDYNYVYLMSNDRQSPQKMNSLFNSGQQRSKIRIQAFQKDKLSKGKGYSAFEFNLSKVPLKMDSFQTDIIIGFENSIEIYDIRKITKPFQKQNENGIKDFYYDPNLQRIFLSCHKGILLFDYK